jgi:type IV secretory pathway ATPase VirB11/archaellum biosynthesis ATPase
MSVVASIELDGGRLVLVRYLEPLAPYLADNTLTEIVVNRPGEIFVEGPDGWTRHEAAALTHATFHILRPRLQVSRDKISVRNTLLCRPA